MNNSIDNISKLYSSYTSHQTKIDIYKAIVKKGYLKRLECTWFSKWLSTTIELTKDNTLKPDM